MAHQADIGVFGLAVMGANLARNAARHKFGVALFNRNPERTDELIAQHGGEGRFFPAKTLQEFSRASRGPARILIMVKAGKPVDMVIDELKPFLEAGDIVIDGGNSLFTDTERRRGAGRRGIRFSAWVSPAARKGRWGPSLMPGGDREAYKHLEPDPGQSRRQGAAMACPASPTAATAGRAISSRWSTTASSTATCSSSPKPTT